MKWKQQVKCAQDDRWAFGPPITLPIPPFPGLMVGAFTVEAVYVCQGSDPDGELRYVPVDSPHMDFILTPSETYAGWTEDCGAY